MTPTVQYCRSCAHVPEWTDNKKGSLRTNFYRSSILIMSSWYTLIIKKYILHYNNKQDTFCLFQSCNKQNQLRNIKHGTCCVCEISFEYENTSISAAAGALPRDGSRSGWLGKSCGWGINSFRAKLYLVLHISRSTVTRGPGRTICCKVLYRKKKRHRGYIRDREDQMWRQNHSKIKCLGQNRSIVLSMNFSLNI